MIIWLASYPRSGNTFFRVLLNSVFGIKTYSIYDDRSDIGADKKLSDVVGHEFLPAGFNLEQARASEQTYFIKTHDGPENSRDDKVIYLLRDGRESTLSYRRYLMDYHGQSNSLRDMLRGQALFGAWGQHVSAWNPGGRENTLLVRFEELIADPQASADAIGEFTGLKPVAREIPTFRELQEKGPQFFRSGKTDSWKNEYSQSDHYAFWLKNHEQMMKYGYSVDMPELFETTAGLGTLLQVISTEYEHSANQALTQIKLLDQRITSMQAEQAHDHGRPAKDTEAKPIAVVANEQGESCFKDGKLDEAQERFLQAIHDDPGFTDGYNNLGVLWWTRGDAAKALEFLAAGLRLDPDHRDLIVNTAEILKSLGKADDAAALYEGYLDRNPVDTAMRGMLEDLNTHPFDQTQQALDAPINDPSPGSAGLNGKADKMTGRVTIATSIAPKELAKQKRAIQSWLDLGFEVISLNIHKELELLQPEFPDVKFVPAGRNGTRLAGKPYVFVDDVLAALQKTACRVVGIVNSDIELRANPQLVDYLHQAATGSFICASRIDVAQAEDSDGKLYHRGFDSFFFDQSIVDRLSKTKFMLGVPWWDYWFPYAVIEQGIPVKRLETPLAYHLRHEINYNSGHMIRFGDEFVSHCGNADFAELFRQCAGTPLENRRLAVLADSVLEYLARKTERLYLPESVSGHVDRNKTVPGTPKISAIVSTYSSESHIAECLSDLVDQSIADQIEIVVIDANSPQNERAVVERFQARFPNIRYLRTPTRIGIYAAWNMAVKLARGDYIISCSTNDRLRFDACEILARTLDENPDVSLVYGNSFLTRVPHESFARPTLCGLYSWPVFDFGQLLDHCMVGPHPMWRRCVHDEIGYFNEDYVALGDQDFWLRMGERNKLLSLPDFTGLYYVSEESITGDADLTQVEADRIHSQYGWRHRYAKWFAERNRRGIAGADPGDGPVTQIFVLAMQNSDAMLANTLDSIANQLNQNWRLTVLSDRPSPDALFEGEARLAWVQCPETETVTAMLDQLVLQDHSSQWVCLIDAGDQLEPAFLSDIHRYLAKYPHWKLVYTDHDLVDANGDLSDPCFKPDWNLELLRSTAYIGNSFVVSRTALMESGGFGVHEEALHYDLVLRTHDQFGGDSIGHVAEILSHRHVDQIQNDDRIALDQQQYTLEQHLQRCGLTTLVREGMSKGSFMLDYQPEYLPKVSILVEAGGSMDRLSSCLQSVLTKTEYPAFEVCVLISCNVQADISGNLERLAAADARLKLVPVDRSLQLADGEYLVWMREEILVLQPNWLHRLVHVGARNDVGVVGARIVDHKKTFVDGGIMLGTGENGVGVRCHTGMHMTSPGYMGRAQLAQEVSAVSGLCMLVSKADFEKAGGYDPLLSGAWYRAIDFCQHIRRQGKRIIWTPYSTLMYCGDPDAIEGWKDGEDQYGDEAEVIVQRWLPELAGDPSYNRNLSRARSDMALEIDTIRGWDPEVDVELRTLGFGVGSYGSWQYRVKQPLDVMAREAVAQRTHAPFCDKQKVRLPTPAEVEMLQPHSLLMHNTLHDEYIEAIEKYKRINKAFIVFGQDDLMTALPPKNPFSKSVYKDMKRRIRKCLALADRLLVSTEPLADALRGMADDIRVVPNYLDSAVWGALKSQRGVSSRPRVGWAGAQQHLGDLELIADVVRETAHEVDWVFFGMCPDFLLPYVKEVHNPVLFSDYPAKLATLNLDFAVAPLERNKFNEAKSNLRILEYGAIGCAVIATDIEPYRNAPLARVANQPRAWINAIRERSNDLDATWQEGDCLRDWVMDHCLLQQHLNAWLMTLDPMAGSKRRIMAGDRAAGL